MTFASAMAFTNDSRTVRMHSDADPGARCASIAYALAADRLTSLPGISDVAAQTILAEIGPDMSPFLTAGHLLSWAGLTPRLDESAGKRRSTR